MAYPLKQNQDFIQVQRRNFAVQPPIKPVIKKQKKAKIHPFVALTRFAFLGAFCWLTLPYNYTNYIEPNIVNRFNNRNFKYDIANLVTPTASYLANANVLGKNIRVTPSSAKMKTFLPIISAGEIEGLSTKIKNISTKYPKLHPCVYVFNYSTGETASYNAETAVPVASMIKIPVLFEFFKQVEEKNKDLSPNKEVIFEDVYKTSGSGHLQYQGTGGKYTLDHIANLMITQSDNSATNLILDYIGGKEAVNSTFRRWGLNKSRMGNWLPDLEGTNKMTAKDIATILYNYDNPKFLNAQSKEFIRKYMSNLPTQKLIRAGLPKNAVLLHKTGDIGGALGDSGIVYLQNGQKYIITTIVTRPHNDPKARELIEEISKATYESIAR